MIEGVSTFGTILKESRSCFSAIVICLHTFDIFIVKLWLADLVIELTIDVGWIFLVSSGLIKFREIISVSIGKCLANTCSNLEEFLVLFVHE